MGSATGGSHVSRQAKKTLIYNMNSKVDIPQTANDLRRKAGEITREKKTISLDNLETPSHDEVRRALHELRVNKIELELKNEEQKAKSP